MRNPRAGTTLFVFVACLALAAWAAPLRAERVDLRVDGTDATENLSGALVLLVQPDISRYFRGRTDRDGNAHFDNVPPGIYQVQFVRSGLFYIGYREVLKGEPATVTIKRSDMKWVYRTPLMTLKPFDWTNTMTVKPFDWTDIVGFVRPEAELAQTTGDTAQTATLVRLFSEHREMQEQALIELNRLDPLKRHDKARTAHLTAIQECDAALARFADPLFGTWVMKPITIINPELCGQVTNHAEIIIRKKQTEFHYTGTSPFRWDLSKADPACRFKFHPQGVATVDVYKEGDKITIKYTYSGPNTFADDHLTLAGNQMTGGDGVNQIVFTRK